MYFMIPLTKRGKGVEIYKYVFKYDQKFKKLFTGLTSGRWGMGYRVGRERFLFLYYTLL